MADLVNSVLDSLIIPKTSHESFHSAYSRHSSPPPSPSTAFPKHQMPTLLQTSRNQRVEKLMVHDVNAYLERPENKALLQNVAAKSQGSSSQMTLPSVVQLGASKSSHYITLLQHICDKKGLTPIWEFEEQSTSSGLRFKGKLQIGGKTILLDRPEPSKKEAKQVLAEKAYPTVQNLEAVVQADAPAASENWVGKLLEYHNSLSPPAVSTWTYFALSPSTFAAEVTIPERPLLPFGSRSVSHPSKKTAKSNAAREAVSYLISTGVLLSDGSLTTSKSKKPRSPVPATLPDSPQESYPARVEALCRELGLVPPVYKLLAVGEDAPASFSGAAYFEREPGLGGPIGEVRHVFGKKKARAECARSVLGVLENIKRKRLGEI